MKSMTLTIIVGRWKLVWCPAERGLFRFRHFTNRSGKYHWQAWYRIL